MSDFDDYCLLKGLISLQMNLIPANRSAIYYLCHRETVKARVKSRYTSKRRQWLNRRRALLLRDLNSE